MRCNGSPTTCTAPEPPRPPLAVAMLEGLIFAEVLKPLAAGLGSFAEIALTSVAQDVFAPKR
jgi:hypothetical protein